MSGAATGIIPRKYKSGSIIYFENDKSENIYILKSGRVILTSQKLDTGEEVKEEVKHGEFFGVKSAIGKYPREETAQTIGETVVLILRLSDFERLVLKNPQVVRKMLRVFSNQLRRVHKMVRSVMGEGDIVNPDVELFRIGEYYYKSGIFQQAEYVYKRLMEHHPDSQYAEVAMQKIKAIQTGQAMPDGPGIGMDVDIEAAPASSNVIDDFNSGDFDNSNAADSSSDFSGDSGKGFDDFSDSSDFNSDNGNDFMDFDDGPASGGPGNDDSSLLTDEMDSFLADDQNDDFNFDMPGEDDFSGGGGDAKTKLEFMADAERHITNENHSEALDALEHITNNTSVNNQNEQDVLEKAFLETGKSHLKLGNQKDALNALSTVVKNYPESQYSKSAFYHIGLLFESVNQGDKAIGYFNKAMNMPPKDDMSAQAMNRIKKLQNQ